MRLGLKILCGDFGEVLIIFVAYESLDHVWLFNKILGKVNILGHNKTAAFNDESDSRD